MESFIGFTFCGVHSSKFNIYAISNGGSYTMPLFANFSDKIESIDGYDGAYYFGTNYSNKTRPIQCVVDRVDESMLRSIQNWLNPKRIGKLTFDESPYKYYTAKISNTPNFNFYPQDDGDENHVYSGTFEIDFTAFDPFAYSYVNSVDDYEYFEDSSGLWYYDSGILYHGETPPVIVNNITKTTNILLYNGGNQSTKPIITVKGSADEIIIKNNTTDQYFKLNDLIDVEIVVDSKKGQVRVQDILASSFHEGSFMELEGSGRVDRYLAIEFTNGSEQITIDKNIDLDIVGRFIAVNDSWYKVVDCNFDLGIVTMNKPFVGITEKYDISVIDLNEIMISGSGLNIETIEFDYKFCYL